MLVQLRAMVRKLSSNKKAAAGGIMCLLLLVVAVLAPQLAPYEPDYMEPLGKFQRPSKTHLMGTDQFGRDILSRVIWGSRISLKVALVAVLSAECIGGFLGLVTGYFRGPIDLLVMRVADVVMCFPTMLMALTLGAALGPGERTVVIALGISYIPSVARLVRGEAMQLREREYVEAALAAGGSHPRILLRHVLPNCLGVAVVQSSLILGSSVLAEAGISYLGYGIMPPNPSWGLMLADAREYMTTASYMSVFPGVAVMYCVLAFNFLGDGLRDLLDPRLKI